MQSVFFQTLGAPTGASQSMLRIVYGQLDMFCPVQLICVGSLCQIFLGIMQCSKGEYFF